MYLKNLIYIEEIMTDTQWAESKYRRSRYWKGDPLFDTEILSSEPISGLCYLRDIYTSRIKDKNKEIRSYFNTHNRDNEKSQEEYLGLIKEKHQYKDHKAMLSEEIEKRMYDEESSPSYSKKDEQIFDPESGLVYNNYSESVYSIAYNEDESGIIYDTTEDKYFEDDITPVERTKTDVYKNWKYW